MFHNYAFKQAYKVLGTDKLAAIININIFLKKEIIIALTI
jgi:hypothetical protein